MVYWITGRKGSGKTTTANRLAANLRKEGQAVLVLDGDEVRQKIADPGYTDEGRKANIELVSRIAALAEDQGIIVIVALVSPKAVWRKEAIKHFKQSQLIYLTGGTLWPGSIYEEPRDDEIPIAAEVIFK